MTKMIRIGVLAALLAATPGLAQTQAQMNAGAAADYRRADATMTRQWSVTNARMKQRDAGNTTRGGGFGYAAALLASQRAWLRFRDTQCVIEAGEFAGGSLQGMTATACKARLTQERTTQLRALEWQR